jgi:hypothetical protein
MPVPSTIHAQELTRVANSSYINQNFKVCLVDAPGSDFDADDAFATVMDNEVEIGLGGYNRQQIGYVSADLGLYDDGKVPMARKAAHFEHDNSLNQVVRFSHVVVLNPSETQPLCITKLATRTSLTDGQSAIFYFDLTLYGVFVAEAFA